MHVPQELPRACFVRWLRTWSPRAHGRYELPYEEEPEQTIEVEDEENEAQRLADGEVAATAAAREAARFSRGISSL